MENLDGSKGKIKFLNKEDIFKGFKSCQPNVSEKIIDYVILKIYGYTYNVKKLDYQKIFEVLFPLIESEMS